VKILRIVAYLTVFIIATSGYIFGFTTNNTAITRTFDKNSAAINELITVTVHFTNNESTGLRGFYYAEEVPQALVVNTVSVKINGSSISSYVFESGSAGDVYPGNIVYRWILETPTAFLENHPLASGSTVEIVYTLNSGQAGTFNLDEFDWAGYYAGGSRAAFGHSENSDKKSLTISHGFCTAIPFLPYTIITQGVYCLTDNLQTNMDSGNAITINTNNVVLDLKGYKIGGQAAGKGTLACGIYANQRKNITIRNGTVRGFYVGIYLQDSGSYTTSQGHIVENIRADLNTYQGLRVEGRGNMIRNNQVVETGGRIPSSNSSGIVIYGPGNRVINNDVYETAADGANNTYEIELEGASGGIVENNRVGNSAPGTGASYGIFVAGSSNVFVTNNSITNLAKGVFYDGTSSGKYRDNIAIGCTVPFTGGTDAGGNN
jgi:parallel beta-helix repeat protein